VTITRLSAEQMNDLLTAYESGELIAEIAKRFNVTAGYVCALARRKGLPARSPERKPRKSRWRKRLVKRDPGAKP